MILLPLLVVGLLLGMFAGKSAASPVQHSHGPHAPPPPGVAATQSAAAAMAHAMVTQAAQVAAGSEMYPSHLRAFAATLLPDYPEWSGVLQARAAAIDSGVLPGARGQ